MRSLRRKGLSSKKFEIYFKNYMELFFQAVELTSLYWKMVFELYDPPEGVLQISDPMRKRFKSVIQNADLSSPLQKNILKDAKKAFQAEIPEKFKSARKALRFPLDRKKVLSIKEEDIGKLEPR